MAGFMIAKAFFLAKIIHPALIMATVSAIHYDSTQYWYESIYRVNHCV